MAQPAPTLAPEAGSAPLLEVEDLRVDFRSSSGHPLPAVAGVSYTVERGRVLAIVGESGSGKSVSVRAVMGLLPPPPRATVSAAAMRFDGEDLLAMPEARRRQLRGRRMSMIFQDVLGSLHPTYPVGWQIVETFRVHKVGLSKREAWSRAVALLDDVRIPKASERVHDYPHQFSGGMRQRVMIAMSMALGPDILIADEPTTALDVTVQAQVMDLLLHLREERGMSLILITHDLGLVRDYADDVAVMYGGRFVETGDVEEVYRAPAHPYTVGLLRSRPGLSVNARELVPVPGAPPQLDAMPPGCAFHPRCALMDSQCEQERPDLVVDERARGVACFHSDKVVDHVAD